MAARDASRPSPSTAPNHPPLLRRGSRRFARPERRDSGRMRFDPTGCQIFFPLKSMALVARKVIFSRLLKALSPGLDQPLAATGAGSLKAFDTLGPRAYIAAPQHGPGQFNPGTRACPPFAGASYRTELFATEARSGTAILTSEEQERDAQTAACRRGLPRELARLICASNPSQRNFGFVAMCNTQSVRAGSRHDLSASSNGSGAINLRV